MTDQELIKLHGGPTKLAKKLGYKLPQGCSRVANWLVRGIPAKVKLENAPIFLSAVSANKR